MQLNASGTFYDHVRIRVEKGEAIILTPSSFSSHWRFKTIKMKHALSTVQLKTPLLTMTDDVIIINHVILIMQIMF